MSVLDLIEIAYRSEANVRPKNQFLRYSLVPFICSFLGDENLQIVHIIGKFLDDSFLQFSSKTAYDWTAYKWNTTLY